ncbi:hypothetical protein GWK47_044071 [Chionoecetes opilio]|uniref:Uncharacterized protein n=1 Tax=Chionoecetes opilio TaxID=41210 RepID=A0A8J4YJL6_CHIOP|nr:hypothetical protein GWK47_044071 [Chionoecetes opilio]
MRKYRFAAGSLHSRRPPGHLESLKTYGGGEGGDDRLAVAMVFNMCLKGVQVLGAASHRGVDGQMGLSKTAGSIVFWLLSLPRFVGPLPVCGLSPLTAGRGCCGAPDQPASRQTGHSASVGLAQLVPGNTLLTIVPYVTCGPEPASGSVRKKSVQSGMQEKLGRAPRPETPGDARARNFWRSAVD